MKALRRRTSAEIRESLHATRKRLNRDLASLEERVEESSKPTQILSRHPALFAVAGAAIGFFVFKNPAAIGRTLTRVAQVGVPFLLKGVLERSGGTLARFAGGLDSDDDR